MTTKGDIFKIPSQYCLKSIFSYLSYSLVLNLLKYNKKLQKKIEINISNYEEYNKYYKQNCYYKVKTRKYSKLFYHTFDHLQNNFSLIFAAFIFMITFLCYLSISIMFLKKKIFDDNNIKDLSFNWKSNPIQEINILDNSNTEKSNSIGNFKGIFNQINEQEIYIWEGKKFYFKYYDKQYKDLFNNKNTKVCGIDHLNNKLYFPNNINCPINYIEITKNPIPSITNLSFKTLQISNNKYLHYTNEYIEGRILIDLKIASKNGFCEYKDNDNVFSDYLRDYNIEYENKGCKRQLYDDSYNVIDNMTLIDLLSQNNLNKAINYLYNNNSIIYLFSRTYIGYENPLKKDINLVIHFGIIKKINCSLFGFLFYIILSLIILCNLYKEICEFDDFKKKLVKIIPTLILIVIFLTYCSIIIYKLIISKRIKNVIQNISYPLSEIYFFKKVAWFIRCDYVLIFFTLFSTIYLIIFVILYLYYAGNAIENIDKINELIQFNNIKIISYNLPNDFHDYDKSKKKFYLLQHFNEFKYLLTKDEKKLIKNINKLRAKHYLPNLIYDDKESIPNLFIEPLSKIILFQNLNIFKLSNKEYLLRYYKNKFKENFNNKNEDILHILLKEDLGKIIIISQGNYEYFIISGTDSIDYNNKELSIQIYKNQRCLESINLSVHQDL